MSQLSAGRSTTCSASLCSGGIASVLYLANANEVASVQTSSAGAATGITMSPTAAVFYEFDFRDYSAQFTENVTVDQETFNVSVEQQFTMVWPCRNHTDMQLVQTLAGNQCGMVAIHGENTGDYWIWGYGAKKRVRLASAESQSGAALSDPNQTTLTLICNTNEVAIEWTAATSAIPTA